MQFILIILPIFLIIGTGFFGQKLLKLDIKPISTVALYLMMPFLTFKTFYTNTFNNDYIYMILFNIILIMVPFFLTIIIGKVYKADKSTISAMLLSTTFPNMGNYGAPVILFAYGDKAFEYAIIIMVIQSLLISTIGIFIASYGSERPTSVKAALLSVSKMPIVYGVILGILFQVTHVTIPPTILEGIDLIGSASIPVITLILGMQLAAIQSQRFEIKYVSSVSLIRMLITPIVIAIIVSYLPINQLIKNIFVLLSAMPVAANTVLLAVQFKTKPDLVSYITLITTLISLISVPITMYFLN